MTFVTPKALFVAASPATLVQFTTLEVMALQTLGIQIHMACPLEHAAISQAALQEFQDKHPEIHWHDVPFVEGVLSLRKNAAAYQKLDHLVKDLHPILLHCYGTIGGIYGRKAAEAQQLPAFYTANDFRIFRRCFPFERLVFRLPERHFGKHTHLLCTVCQEDAAYAKKHLHPEKCFALPDTERDFSRYAVPVRSREEIRKELGIPEDATLLLSVGTLRMQKRLRIVLQAMARLREQQQLHYVICGTGPDLPFLQKLTENLQLQERVHFVGYRTDVPDLLGAADIFCMPSRRESGGIAALEAMAAGLPLITVRSHGTREYAVQGEGAFCLKTDLVKSCTDAIQELEENRLLRKQMGAHNRALIKEFADKADSEQERMQLLREEYRQILEKREE